MAMGQFLTSSAFARVALVAWAAAALLAGCGDKKDEKAAYAACIEYSKQPTSKVAKAEFGSYENTKFFFTQDSAIAVRVPYKLDGKDGIQECIMVKQQDGSLKSQIN